MNGSESMWRTELLHPMLVHLPIATLLLASVAGLCSVLLRENARVFARKMSLTLLAVGVVTGWIGIYTGNLSYNIEVRTLCDPKVLQAHSWWSYASVIGYSAVLTLQMAQSYGKRIKIVLPQYVYALLLMAAMGGLLYAGHLGASVVYEQGAAVHKPNADCSDYNLN